MTSGDVESEDTWNEVFLELRQRGIWELQWLISDGHKGIQTAVRTQYGRPKNPKIL